MERNILIGALVRAGASQTGEASVKLLEGESNVEYMIRVFGPEYRELLKAFKLEA